MAKQEEECYGVQVLARIWQEDDVWNVSAFDLPVVAFGQTLPEAESHFEEALEAHFAALAQLQRLDTVLAELRDLAQERDFYVSRMAPHVTVQSFPLRAVSPEHLSNLAA